MKNTLLKSALIVSIGSLLFISCKKDNTSESNPVLAISSTSAITSITGTTASSGGNITNDGGSAITARGVCWNTSANPITANNKTNDGAGTGVFTSVITGLTPNTTYYLRSYAVNSTGTGYGNEMIFTTTANASDTVSDIDGNVYHSVVIGSQIWMTQDLRVTHYRNGDAIPNVTVGMQWFALTSDAYCNYNNNPLPDGYGRMYNWYAANDSRNIAPIGWHVSTEAEWNTMENYLGVNSAANQLRETGTTNWLSPNISTNSTGFTALPGGYRADLGAFTNSTSIFGKFIQWWCKDNVQTPFVRITNYSPVSNAVFHDGNYDKSYGLYLRCVKD